MPHILLLEDNTALADAFATLLSHHGYTVEVAMSLAEARQILSAPQHPITLAILDATLPDGSGLDLLPLGDIQSIVLSGHSERSLTALASSRGAAAVLLKPVNTARLMATLTRVLAPPAQSLEP